MLDVIPPLTVTKLALFDCVLRPSRTFDVTAYRVWQRRNDGNWLLTTRANLHIRESRFFQPYEIDRMIEAIMDASSAEDKFIWMR